MRGSDGMTMATPECFYERLLADHRSTEAILDTLAAALAEERAVAEVVRLFQTLVAELAWHFYAEEHALFPVLSQYKTMVLMEAEHDKLLETQAALEADFTASVSQGEASKTLEESAKAFRKQLEAHIYEEERGIFPLADAVLEPEEKALVARKLAEVYAGFAAGALENPALARPNPTFTVDKTALLASPTKPVVYERLFEAEHATVQHIQLQAGHGLKLHWVPEHQCLLVVSGEVAFHTEGESRRLSAGMQVTMEPHCRFWLEAESDTHLVAVKVWPRPHFIRV